MDLNKLRNKAYKTACEHGFHDKELSNEHCLCLIISELMEAVEADREGKRAYSKEVYNRHIQENHEKYGDDCAGNDHCTFEALIKDTVEDELADAVIRLLDLAGLRKLNLNRFALVNVVSKKKIFTENIYAIVRDIINYKYSLEELVNYAITQVFVLADMLGIDLFWHIEQKMRYNELRPMLNGKAY